MKFENFLKDKFVSLVLLIFSITTIEIFLLSYKVDSFIKIYIPLIILGLYCISLLIEYINKKRFYARLQGTLDKLNEKYLITELINNPNYAEEKILKEVMEQVNKSMLENVNKYKYITEDYKEYVELWIHEVKTPIAAAKMIIENNKSEATKGIEDELEKIENYIAQALYYARSNTIEKDYYIRKSNLKEIVNECIKKNKNQLIQNKIKINTYNIKTIVSTDSKWVEFILSQILQNSIRYKSTEIEIYSKNGKENVILYIKDNGIGIKQGEISRVFEKGFTGIGLYLCKKLCDKLGIAIILNSTEEKGTEVKLIFPNSSYTNLS